MGKNVNISTVKTLLALGIMHMKYSMFFILGHIHQICNIGTCGKDRKVSCAILRPHFTKYHSVLFGETGVFLESCPVKFLTVKS